jgi:glycosyltransferase involved in cell wall biosynthesis
MKKLLIISPYHPYQKIDGITGPLVKIVEHFKEKGAKIDLFCLGPKDGVEKKNNINIFTFRPKITNLVSYYFSFSFWPWNNLKFFSPSLKRSLEKIDQNQVYDLVYLHSPFLMIYLPLFKNIPSVFNSIDCLSVWLEEQLRLEKNFLKKIHLKKEATKTKKAEKEILSFARRVIVTTSEDKDLLLRQNPSLLIKVIPNGVDIDYFKPQKTKLENAIVFSGVMNYPPNTQAVIYFYHKIWPYLKKNIPNLLWYIVGSSPNRSVKKLSRKDKNIIVTGYVEDIREYLLKAKVFISPLISGRGIKNKILEAMALGKAIVASSKSIEGLEVVPNRDLILAYQPQDFFRAILKLIKDEETRFYLEENARRFVEKNFNWPKILVRYEELFSKNL